MEAMETVVSAHGTLCSHALRRAHSTDTVQWGAARGACHSEDNGETRYQTIRTPTFYNVYVGRGV